jgi:hypothetical protein
MKQKMKPFRKPRNAPWPWKQTRAGLECMCQPSTPWLFQTNFEGIVPEIKLCIHYQKATCVFVHSGVYYFPAVHNHKRNTISRRGGR